jgi:hypothetical protein
VFALCEQMAGLQAEREQLLCSCQLRREALERYLERQRATAQLRLVHKVALLSWRRGCERQQSVRGRWREVSDALLRDRGCADKDERGAASPAATFAGRLLRRRRRPEGSLAWAAAAGRARGLVLGGWRELARQAAVWRELEHVSGGRWGTQATIVGHRYVLVCNPGGACMQVYG